MWNSATHPQPDKYVRYGCGGSGGFLGNGCTGYAVIPRDVNLNEVLGVGPNSKVEIGCGGNSGTFSDGGDGIVVIYGPHPELGGRQYILGRNGSSGLTGNGGKGKIIRRN
ncbi:hypothetical protein Fcan01_27519 [Folsomia candida]|uniref:Uncharacterized protein n=1 Tax=Folsomia candida TaxID=158441 RepID=A0A226CXJ2_FOLCA|nr:hypothetical protein Fcan01_27519 [Folsomia candida]